MKFLKTSFRSFFTSYENKSELFMRITYKSVKRIYINPFNDGQIEYIFTVTASGIQSDAKQTTSKKDDLMLFSSMNSSITLVKRG